MLKDRLADRQACRRQKMETIINQTTKQSRTSKPSLGKGA